MKTKTLILLCLFGFFLIQSCKKDEPQQTGPSQPYYPNGVGEIGSVGGTVAMDDANSPFFGAKVYIPEGAVDSPVEIEIRLASNDIQVTGDTSAKVFEFLPHGIQFNKPVTITLPIEGDTSNVAIHEYIPEDDELDKLIGQSIDFENDKVSATTTHFSFYVPLVSWHYLPINIFKTNNGKIATTFSINGLEAPVLGPISNRGWQHIPTRFLVTQWDNAWEVMTQRDGLIKSQFTINLIEYSNNKSEIIQELEYSINRPPFSEGFLAEFVDDHSSNEDPFYTSETLVQQDFTDENVGLDNGIRWFSGAPLVVYFDEFEPDASAEYYVRVEWALRASSRLTPELALSNFDQRKSYSQLQFKGQADFDSNPTDGILDLFQNGSGGQNDSAPIPDFEFSPANPEVFEEIQFTNLTENGLSYTWLFGDGTTIYNEENPTHTYTSAGTYDVVLTAGNNNGDGQIVKSITVYEAGQGGNLTNDLISYWNFENGFDDVHGDNDGNPSTGVSPPNTAGIVGSAPYFDGTSQAYINCGNDQSLNITSEQITITAWVKSENTEWADIISKGRDYTSNRGYHLRWLGNTDEIRSIYRLSNGDNSVPTHGPIEEEVWYHIASTYDGVTGKIYLNGELVSEDVAEGAIGSGTTPFIIGAHSAGPTSWYQWKGNIDEVGVWERVLNSSEIESLYNNGNGLPYSQF